MIQSNMYIEKKERENEESECGAKNRDKRTYM